MSLIKEERVYFYGLDEFRAIAALLVFVHHIESFKSRAGFPSLLGFNLTHVFVAKIGLNAVIAFFVLSGFLITYLLLTEKQKTGKIDVKAFYIRRILRIWPLYFLVVLIGFVVMPLLNETGLFKSHEHYTSLIEHLDYKSLVLFVLFLSNFALIYYKHVAGAAQSWSVSMEEQFYLIWPHVIKYSKGIKQTLFIVVSLLIVKIVGGKLLFFYFGKTAFPNAVNLLCIEFMFIGAIAAILLFWETTKIKMKRLLENKWVLLLILLLIFIELARYSHSLILAFLFAFLILLITSQRIEIKFLKYFGKISYGIYMLHPFVLFLTFSIVYNIKNPILYNLAYYGLSFGLTILLAGVSYKYMEAPILRFKRKHTIIESGAK